MSSGGGQASGAGHGSVSDSAHSDLPHPILFIFASCALGGNQDFDLLNCIIY